MICTMVYAYQDTLCEEVTTTGYYDLDNSNRENRSTDTQLHN